MHRLQRPGYIQRLRYVTARYEQLQGLRLVPLGIPFLLSSAWREGLLPWVPGTAGAGARVWLVAMFLPAIGLSMAAKVYYRHRFGDVQAATPVRAPIAAPAFTAILLAAVSLQSVLQSPISIPSVILALGVACLGIDGGIMRPHYVAVAATLGVFALSGAIGVPFHIRDVLWDRVIGMSLLVIGIGDHLLLRGTLVPVTDADTV
jgi:hypothetical protein